MTNDKIGSIPQKLQDYLVEQASECADITMTVSDDNIMWIIRPYNLEDWLVLVSWYPNQEDYQIMNITGMAYDKMRKIF
jgi:hypothetical protein